MIEIASLQLVCQNIKSNEIVVIAGKGHEIYQEYKNRKYFSDKDCILKSIKEKNRKLNNNWKTNIIDEKLKNKLGNKILINKACINSKKVKKNNIFWN